MHPSLSCLARISIAPTSTLFEWIDGTNFARLLPAAMMMGAAYPVLVETFARSSTKRQRAFRPAARAREPGGCMDKGFREEAFRDSLPKKTAHRRNA